MMAAIPLTAPAIPPVDPQNIPELLRREPRWVCWRVGSVKTTGKFDKIPINPLTARNINALDPQNWLSFDHAMDAHRRGIAQGVGIVLSDQHPIDVAGLALYLTAIDLDQCVQRKEEVERLRHELDRPYVEVSPSRKGLRMFGLSTVPLKGGNAGDGRELYSTKRFMTVTGWGARGTIRNISAGLIAVERRWFPPTVATSIVAPTQPVMVARPETPANVAEVLSMLDHVSSDTDYATWRDIIWSITSTAWACTPQIAHHWSKRALHRYDANAVDKLLVSFDPSHGITLGTLAHHARQSNWNVRLSQPSEQSTASPFKRLLTAAELRQLPAVPYIVRGLLPARGLAAIYGEPGSGKSFLALDLAHAIANGRQEWFGFPVRQAPVAYVALEGQGGMTKRVAALEKHTGQSCCDELRFWCSEFQLLRDDSVDSLGAEIIATIGLGAAVIIDTLNQASPGADENSSQDMGRIISSAKRVAEIVGGPVILIHHSGKTRSLGLRGHSSLLAAMDAVIEVLRDAGLRRWRTVKAKDDSGDIVRDFQLTSHEVGQDDYGPVTSCAVQQAIHAGAPTKAPIRGKNQQAAIAELRRKLTPQGQAMAYDTAISLVAAVLHVGRERDRAKEAIEALIRGGHLSLSDGGVSLAP